MAKSSITFLNQSAGRTSFDLAFEGPAPGYLSKEHIKLYRNMVLQSGGFDWTSDSTVSLTTPTLAGENILFRRETPTDTPIVDYEMDGIIREQDLDAGILQMLFIVHQIEDGYFDVSAAGWLDANNKKIINVADGTDPTDGVNLQQLTNIFPTWEATYNAIKAQTEAARDVALSHRNLAETYMDNALAAQTAAESAKTGSESARDIAIANKDLAIAEKGATAVLKADTQAIKDDTELERLAADEAAALAGAWAAQADGVPVESGLYSALHYSKAAKGYAQNLQPKHTYGAAAAPTGDDNWEAGYRPGSIWTTTAPAVYRCTDDGNQGVLLHDRPKTPTYVSPDILWNDNTITHINDTSNVARLCAFKTWRLSDSTTTIRVTGLGHTNRTEYSVAIGVGRGDLPDNHYIGQNDDSVGVFPFITGGAQLYSDGVNRGSVPVQVTSPDDVLLLTIDKVNTQFVLQVGNDTAAFTRPEIADMEYVAMSTRNPGCTIMIQSHVQMGPAVWKQTTIDTGAIEPLDFRNMTNVPSTMFAIEELTGNTAAKNATQHIRRTKTGEHFAVYLPANPPNGFACRIQDITGFADTNPIRLMVLNPAHRLNRLATEYIDFNINFATFEIVWDDNLGWLIT